MVDVISCNPTSLDIFSKSCSISGVYFGIMIAAVIDVGWRVHRGSDRFWLALSRTVQSHVG